MTKSTGKESVILDENAVVIPAPQPVNKKNKKKEKIIDDEPKVYIIFKRCGKASNIVKLPEKRTKLKMASFMKSLVEKSEIKAGDVINTAKNNQLLIVNVLNYNLSYVLDIEDSTFEISKIQKVGENTLNEVDLVKIPALNINGEKTYIINKRPYGFSDLKDTVRELDLSKDIMDLIKEERIVIPNTNNRKVSYYLYLPNYVYSLLGAVKGSFFSQLLE